MTAEQDAEQLWLGELRVQIIDPRKETPGAQPQEDGDEAASTSTHCLLYTSPSPRDRG